MAHGLHARAQNSPTNAQVAILSGILLLSGVGVLIFETLWLRLSGLAFGNSVWAAAVILSSFMAGLALGNALAASARIRRWRPLHLYALLEVLVAFFGCTIVFVLPVLGDALRPDAERLRADIQRELLAVAGAEASSAPVVPAPASPPKE